jgi:hypothetical protein
MLTHSKQPYQSGDKQNTATNTDYPGEHSDDHTEKQDKPSHRASQTTQRRLEKMNTFDSLQGTTRIWSPVIPFSPHPNIEAKVKQIIHLI